MTCSASFRSASRRALVARSMASPTMADMAASSSARLPSCSLKASRITTTLLGKEGAGLRCGGQLVNDGLSADVGAGVDGGEAVRDLRVGVLRRELVDRPLRVGALRLLGLGGLAGDRRPVDDGLEERLGLVLQQHLHARLVGVAGGGDCDEGHIPGVEVLQRLAELE